MNRLKTLMLLAALTALLLWLGELVGGRSGMIVALFIAAIMNFGSYWFSDKIVLSMYGAQPVSQEEAPELYEIVGELARRERMPMPKIYILPEDTPNAFATGRNPQHAAVAVTAGILKLLNRDELFGVLAHELGHVKHRDTLIMSVVATIAGALSMLSRMAMWGGMGGSRYGRRDDRGSNPILALIGIIVAPIIAMLIQLAISRSREYGADEEGAHVSGDPLALASALQKIEAYSRRIPMRAGSPATAHLFIINPFKEGGLAALFSTHPPTEARIARLMKLAQASGQWDSDRAA
jgi:heat shock protein HtpX